MERSVATVDSRVPCDPRIQGISELATVGVGCSHALAWTRFTPTCSHQLTLHEFASFASLALHSDALSFIADLPLQVGCCRFAIEWSKAISAPAVA